MRCWTSSYSRAETWNARKIPAIPLGRRTPSAKTGRFWNEGLAVFHRVCYTPFGLRNAAKGGAPWRHAQNMDDKNQIAREPVFQAERVPVRADRTRLPRRKRGHQHLREGLNGYVLMRRVPVLFCAEN